LTSLALVCFPEKGDLEILERILAGGLSKMMEAGCTVVGGHSIRDDETKFGYSVTGMIHPQRVLANAGAVAGDRLLFTKALGTGVVSTAIKAGRAQAGAVAGDRLLFTKALGTGVISTAIKRGVAQGAWVEAVVRSMTTLNKTAAEVVVSGIQGAGLRPAAQTGASGPTWVVHAMTDVTGFGLIG